jgi:hypothetical protein
MSSANTKSTRPWSRITIRVMMLLVLIVALLLGRQVNKAREQREAVAAVQNYGGWVHYDYEFVSGKIAPGRGPLAPRWLRSLLGDEYFQNVRQVSLVYDDSAGKRLDNTSLRACDDLLKQISTLPGLTGLMLIETQATDDGLRHIGKMTDLEELYIWDAKFITDAGVSHLSRLTNLKMVHIGNSNLTDDSLARISSLPKMEEMSLQQNHFSDEGLARLSGKERLKRVCVGLGDVRITDGGLAHLADFEKLELLDLQKSRVTHQGLEQLKRLPNLKELWLSETSVSDQAVQSLRETIPSLKALPVGLHATSRVSVHPTMVRHQWTRMSFDDRLA